MGGALCFFCLPVEQIRLHIASAVQQRHTMLAEKSLLEKLGLKQQEEPREVVRKCQRMIRTEIRGVERQMMGAGPRPLPTRLLGALEGAQLRLLRASTRPCIVGSALRHPPGCCRANRRRRCRRQLRLTCTGARAACLPPPLAEVQREQKKAEKLIKDAAKRNDLVSAKVPAGFSNLLPAASALLRLLRARRLVCRRQASSLPCCQSPACCRPAPVLVSLSSSPVHSHPTTLAAQIIAKEVVNMRRTVTKLAMNKATFLALSNQMTEQLGARWAAPHELLLLLLPPGQAMACAGVHARAASRG